MARLVYFTLIKLFGIFHAIPLPVSSFTIQSGALRGRFPGPWGSGLVGRGRELGRTSSLNPEGHDDFQSQLHVWLVCQSELWRPPTCVEMSGEAALL